MAKETKEEKEIYNPFLEGANYKDFLAAIPKGQSVAEYLTPHFNEEVIAWLVNDLKNN